MCRTFENRPNSAAKKQDAPPLVERSSAIWLMCLNPKPCGVVSTATLRIWIKQLLSFIRTAAASAKIASLNCFNFRCFKCDFLAASGKTSGVIRFSPPVTRNFRIARAIFDKYAFSLSTRAWRKSRRRRVENLSRCTRRRDAFLACDAILTGYARRDFGSRRGLRKRDFCATVFRKASAKVLSPATSENLSRLRAWFFAARFVSLVFTEKRDASASEQTFRALAKCCVWLCKRNRARLECTTR